MCSGELAAHLAIVDGTGAVQAGAGVAWDQGQAVLLPEPAGSYLVSQPVMLRNAAQL